MNMWYGGPKDHTHLEQVWCPQGSQCSRRGAPDMYVRMGPITGMTGELMRHLGHDPAEHPDLLQELAQAIGEEMLDVGRAILAERGLAVQDSVL